ncbi:uncharacterized protein [Periplaneta americana]|uniref:uncharacterized protein isoform X2 n=1 Tax=Periplaneta americana TaxID=6978 RepID=UPI0037E7FA79
MSPQKKKGLLSTSSQKKKKGLLSTSIEEKKKKKKRLFPQHERSLIVRDESWPEEKSLENISRSRMHLLDSFQATPHHLRQKKLLDDDTKVSDIAMSSDWTRYLDKTYIQSGKERLASPVSDSSLGSKIIEEEEMEELAKSPERKQGFKRSKVAKGKLSSDAFAAAFADWKRHDPQLSSVIDTELTEDSISEDYSSPVLIQPFQRKKRHRASGAVYQDVFSNSSSVAFLKNDQNRLASVLSDSSQEDKNIEDMDKVAESPEKEVRFKRRTVAKREKDFDAFQAAFVDSKKQKSPLASLIETRVTDVSDNEDNMSLALRHSLQRNRIPRTTALKDSSNRLASVLSDNSQVDENIEDMDKVAESPQKEMNFKRKRVAKRNKVSDAFQATFDDSEQQKSPLSSLIERRVTDASVSDDQMSPVRKHSSQRNNVSRTSAAVNQTALNKSSKSRISMTSLKDSPNRLASGLSDSSEENESPEKEMRFKQGRLTKRNKDFDAFQAAFDDSEQQKSPLSSLIERRVTDASVNEDQRSPVVKHSSQRSNVPRTSAAVNQTALNKSSKSGMPMTSLKDSPNRLASGLSDSSEENENIEDVDKSAESPEKEMRFKQGRLTKRNKDFDAFQAAFDDSEEQKSPLSSLIEKRVTDASVNEDQRSPVVKHSSQRNNVPRTSAAVNQTALNKSSKSRMSMTSPKDSPNRLASGPNDSSEGKGTIDDMDKIESPVKDICFKQGRVAKRNIDFDAFQKAFDDSKEQKSPMASLIETRVPDAPVSEDHMSPDLKHPSQRNNVPRSSAAVNEIVLNKSKSTRSTFLKNSPNRLATVLSDISEENYNVEDMDKVAESPKKEMRFKRSRAAKGDKEFDAFQAAFDESMIETRVTDASVGHDHMSPVPKDPSQRNYVARTSAAVNQTAMNKSSKSLSSVTSLKDSTNRLTSRLSYSSEGNKDMEDTDKVEVSPQKEIRFKRSRAAKRNIDFDAFQEAFDDSKEQKSPATSLIETRVPDAPISEDHMSPDLKHPSQRNNVPRRSAAVNQTALNKSSKSTRSTSFRNSPKRLVSVLSDISEGNDNIEEMDKVTESPKREVPFKRRRVAKRDKDFDAFQEAFDDSKQQKSPLSSLIETRVTDASVNEDYMSPVLSHPSQRNNVPRTSAAVNQTVLNKSSKSTRSVTSHKDSPNRLASVLSDNSEVNENIEDLEKVAESPEREVRFKRSRVAKRDKDFDAFQAVFDDSKEKRSALPSMIETRVTDAFINEDYMSPVLKHPSQGNNVPKASAAVNQTVLNKSSESVRSRSSLKNSPNRLASVLSVSSHGGQNIEDIEKLLKSPKKGVRFTGFRKKKKVSDNFQEAFDDSKQQKSPLSSLIETRVTDASVNEDQTSPVLSHPSQRNNVPRTSAAVSQTALNKSSKPMRSMTSLKDSPKRLASVLNDISEGNEIFEEMDKVAESPEKEVRFKRSRGAKRNKDSDAFQAAFDDSKQQKSALSTLIETRVTDASVNEDYMSPVLSHHSQRNNVPRTSAAVNQTALNKSSKSMRSMTSSMDSPNRLAAVLSDSSGGNENIEDLDKVAESREKEVRFKRSRVAKRNKNSDAFQAAFDDSKQQKSAMSSLIETRVTDASVNEDYMSPVLSHNSQRNNVPGTSAAVNQTALNKSSKSLRSMTSSMDSPNRLAAVLSDSSGGNENIEDLDKVAESREKEVRFTRSRDAKRNKNSDAFQAAFEDSKQQKSALSSLIETRVTDASVNEDYMSPVLSHNSQRNNVPRTSAAVNQTALNKSSKSMRSMTSPMDSPNRLAAVLSDSSGGNENIEDLDKVAESREKEVRFTRSRVAKRNKNSDAFQAAFDDSKQQKSALSSLIETRVTDASVNEDYMSPVLSHPSQRNNVPGTSAAVNQTALNKFSKSLRSITSPMDSPNRLAAVLSDSSGGNENIEDLDKVAESREKEVRFTRSRDAKRNKNSDAFQAAFEDSKQQKSPLPSLIETRVTDASVNEDYMSPVLSHPSQRNNIPRTSAAVNRTVLKNSSKSLRSVTSLMYSRNRLAAVSSDSSERNENIEDIDKVAKSPEKEMPLKRSGVAKRNKDSDAFQLKRGETSDLHTSSFDKKFSTLSQNRLRPMKNLDPAVEERRAKLRIACETLREKIKKESEERLKMSNLRNVGKELNVPVQLTEIKKLPRKTAPRKPIHSYLLVNGKPYRPRLKRPKPWATPRLYKLIIKKCEEAYGELSARRIAEKFVVFLCEKVTQVIRRKHYDKYKDNLEEIKRALYKIGIIKSLLDYFVFIEEYLPFLYRIKAIPCTRAYGQRTGPPWVPGTDLFADLGY